MAPTTDYLSSGEGVFKGPSVLMGMNDSYAIVLGSDNTYKVVRLPYGGSAQTEALKFDATAAATFAGPVTILAGGPLAVAGTVNMSGPVNISTGPLTVVTSGVTITAGGLAVTAGGATVTGNVVIGAGTLLVGSTATITTGGLQITAGGITATGNVALTSATLAVGSTLTVTTGGVVLSQGGLLSNVPTPATTSGTVVPVSSGVITVGALVVRVFPTGAATSVAITTGLTDGQLLVIVNNGTSPVSFATQATSRIATPGTTLALINQQQSKLFAWSAIDALWYPAGASSI